ncbi:hypothetical protein CXG81DRAFT_17520 [Caulochytrium protostelioides]|uniref:Tetraspanin n=1 Tax=Caulochytrium protostelioides TaxID=1555241 RepID=A0A4P9XCM7_9FUNG|nr:hypothetical protein CAUPRSCDRAFT_11068 [Caulochytrium protostelioides]RKP02901.1 hypothetical protein CXG81DRAFT_17520 [Caulochytrium protostelioides]|eukprot:RKP02901.1 hypothetical protein CXG81DRAFT_17520 [Caulochytrium protostelioides]
MAPFSFANAWLALANGLLLLCGIILTTTAGTGLRAGKQGTLALGSNSIKVHNMYIGLVVMGIFILFTSLTGIVGSISPARARFLAFHSVCLTIGLICVLTFGIYTAGRVALDYRIIYNMSVSDWMGKSIASRKSLYKPYHCCSFTGPGDWLGPYDVSLGCHPESKRIGCQDALTEYLAGRFKLLVAATVLTTFFLLVCMIATGAVARRRARERAALFSQKARITRF